jgi:hypothetical protein
MSLNYLERLAQQRLPFKVSDPGEIDHVAVLKAAQLITATIPAADQTGYVGSAVVIAVTQAGQDALTTMRLHRGRT